MKIGGFWNLIKGFCSFFERINKEYINEYFGEK